MSIIDYISRYFILYQVFILGLICRQWYYHFGNEARSGQTIYKIRKPRQVIAVNAGLYVVLLLLCIYGIWIGRTKESTYFFILLFAELVVGFLIDCLPQRICENGIRTYQGFVPWPSIYKIRDSGKKHVIMILYRAEPDEARQCGASDIRDARKGIDIHGKKRSKKIYCRPEEKEQLEKLILEKAETQQRAGTSVLGQGKSEVNEL